VSWIDWRWSRAQLGASLDPENVADRVVASSAGDPPFYGIVMLAMARADSINLAHLQAAWPHVWQENLARHWAPFGLLESDPEGLKQKVMGDHYGVTSLESEL
jgi:hypothetical protein